MPAGACTAAIASRAFRLHRHDVANISASGSSTCLLTIVTLGIYSAWAKVRRQRYFYGNTSLAGASFDYHARPVQILIGRIVVLAMLVVYNLTLQFQPIVGGLIAVALPVCGPVVHHARPALQCPRHQLPQRPLRLHRQLLGRLPRLCSRRGR